MVQIHEMNFSNKSRSMLFSSSGFIERRPLAFHSILYEYISICAMNKLFALIKLNRNKVKYLIPTCVV